ncbi:MAG TPA: PEGA domain-containing protein [Polyangia bacterium]|nr:PEGA domain-containing protein [Polyangia bacterium]
MRFGHLLTVCCAAFAGQSAHAQTAPSEIAFVYFGEADPTGVDQSFLALGRRRGAPVAREAPGQLAEQTPGAALSRAIAAYGQLHFAEAIAALDAVEREVAPRGGGGLTRGELVDLHAYRAAARMANGDEASAWDDLLAAAVLAPSRPLDPARFPPRVVEAARRAAQAIGAPARLAIASAPDDALVIVDGELVGRGHVELLLPAGAHLVRAERSGFRAAGSRVDVGASGAETRLALEPAPAPTPAQIAARGIQSGARRVIAAFVSLTDGRAAVELQLVDVKSARVEGRAWLADDERLTTGDLLAAVDSLLGATPEPEGARGKLPQARAWYRRPLVWALVGGATAALALGVGLGVGLTNSHGSGFGLRIDLGSAR